MFKYNNISIDWYGHDTFVIKNNKTICIDPYNLTKPIKADIVLISHNHFDHLSENDLDKVINKNTIILAANECKDKLSLIKCKKIFMFPKDEQIIDYIKIKATPAYNINKINPDTNKPFHPKEDNKIGFLITIDTTSIYHTGDSDFIPEMYDIQTDVLLIPISGTYVMDANEAAIAINKIKPNLAIPMHYGTIIGSTSDAKKFKQLVNNYKIEILTKTT